MCAASSGGEGKQNYWCCLSISEETVKAHLRNILSKLEAKDRTHAVTIGLKRGIIDI
jgi:two-component system NarL family response regulator